MRSELTVLERNNQGSNIEVWEDLVNIKDLLISLFICSLTTLTAYYLAPNEAPMPLFFGIVGAVFGFVLASIVIKPKRNFVEQNREEE